MGINRVRRACAAAALGLGLCLSAPAQAENAKFVYGAATDNDMLVGFTVDAGGNLVAVPGGAIAQPYPVGLGVDPQGKYVLVGTTGNGYAYKTGIVTYRIDQVTGKLSQTSKLDQDSPLISFQMHPSGTLAFAVTASSNTTRDIITYDVNDGIVTAKPNQPVSLPMAQPLVEMRLDPSGSYLFVKSDDSGKKISVYQVDGSTGALTLKGAKTLPSLIYSMVAAKGSDAYLYVSTGTNIYGYKVNSAGGLDDISGTPISISDGIANPLAVSPAGGHLLFLSTSKVSTYAINQTNGTLTATGASVSLAGNGGQVASVKGGTEVYVIGESRSLTTLGIDPATGGLALRGTGVTGIPESENRVFLAATAGQAVPAAQVVPAAPKSLSALAWNMSAELNWDAVAGATSYNAYYSTEPNPRTTGTKVAGVVNGAKMAGLFNGRPYYIAVTAVNAAGEGPASPVAGPVGAFIKHGDNGTASCSQFCGSKQWSGGVGVAVGAYRGDTGAEVPVGIPTNYLPNGKELACICANPVPKYGDNGTASCATYCAGRQWPGVVGGCVGAVRGDTGADVACTTATGLLPNGAELTCGCDTRVPQ